MGVSTSKSKKCDGNLIDAPTKEDGLFDSDSLRAASDVPADRPLITQLPGGSNQNISPPEETGDQTKPVAIQCRQPGVENDCDMTYPH